MAILTNKEVITISQDVLGKQCVKKYETNDGMSQVYLTPLVNDEYAIAFLNRNDLKSESINVTWKDLGLNPSTNYQISDLWKQQDVGEAKGYYEAQNIPSHGTTLVKLIP